MLAERSLNVLDGVKEKHRNVFRASPSVLVHYCSSWKRQFLESSLKNGTKIILILNHSNYTSFT